MIFRSISLRDLARCDIDPMQVSLSLSKQRDFTEPCNYSTAKQISAHLGDTLDLEGIRGELRTVRPDASAAEHVMFAKMTEACNRPIWRPAVRNDVSVSLQMYSIIGRVDRLFEDGVAVVRCSAAPPSGIHATDRLHMTAYFLCLEEGYSRPFSRSVKYFGSGTIRHLAVPLHADRHALRTVFRGAEAAFQGEIPRPIHGRHCLSCRMIGATRPSGRNHCLNGCIRPTNLTLQQPCWFFNLHIRTKQTIDLHLRDLAYDIDTR